MWARGDSPGRNALDYHGGSSSTHGALQLNLLSEVAPPPPPPAGSDLAPLHGAMMFSAFGILMVFGVFVGRYLKRYWWWFPLRTSLLVTTLPLFLTLSRCSRCVCMSLHCLPSCCSGDCCLSVA